MAHMTSTRPYLIRAFYDWIVDNQLTPYILVDAEIEGVQVPREFVKDGHIVLNISPMACQGLHIQNDRIIFSARFSGVALQVCVPPKAVQAIYARENGRGMIFNDKDDDHGGGGDDGGFTPKTKDDLESSEKTESKDKEKPKPKLTVVK